MRSRVVSSALAGALLLVGLVSPAGTAAESTPPDPAPQPLTPPPAYVDPHLDLEATATDDALTAALDDGSITEARYALERARSLFTPGRVERRYGRVAKPDPRAATLILRDLAVHDDDLAPAARAQAGRILARPTDPFHAQNEPYSYRANPARQHCTENLCVHWTTKGTHRPPTGDRDGNALPDQVDRTLAAFQRSWRMIVDDYGYRAPRPDGTHGGSAALDVYLADTGADDGIYGYCTSDQPGWDTRRLVWAYCVVDDDFSRAQFGAPPLDSLRVTAAHEFFHAVQFAYDFWEDLWLMEGTATWMEDQVYDGVDDNHQYLRRGPLTHPHLPLDFGVYEPWIFFRFMSERFGTAGADRPDVVRRIWHGAAADTGGRNDYSLPVVARVARSHGTPFRRLFAEFGRTGPFARRTYAEGRRYPRAPMTHASTLGGRRDGTGDRRVTVHHLANRHVAFRPARGLPRRSRLRLRLDLPSRVRGSEASVTVQRRDGSLRPLSVRLSRRGNARVRVPFGRRPVARVVLTLTNASTRMRCGQGTYLACEGMPRDDRLRFRYNARVIR